jgi:hypothetical protein
MEDIRLLARREVIEGEDLPTLVEEQLGKVRADEAGAAGDRARIVSKINDLLTRNNPNEVYGGRWLQIR